ncbi:unnamed protein product [Cuscuta campestris]|uniref:DNA helicase Pif1-like 2B domain-containing protein n=1 Tax=Cuscuta campestris TaxID=132261 RepID=A0A484NHK2_9ASTE|nr:unnamed protein product [Cuscuta campestris]
MEIGMSSTQPASESDRRLDQRVYNTPTASQVAAIWVEDNNTETPESKHIRVYAHSDGYTASTFREGAERMGLLTENAAADVCLEEAVMYQMPSSLRRLFATLLVFCDIPNPRELWAKYKKYLYEDFSQVHIYTPLEMETMTLKLIGDITEALGKSLPPHTLVLKKNCPVILLRNLNPCEGLCNGTRLICDAFHDHLISCFIAFGEYKGKHVFIPRIPLEMSRDERCAIPFKRTQFPVKLCFAMTINKSQGQTLEFAGIFLRRPVFCHGQLYVAMSRAKNAASIKMLIYDEIDNSKTTNATANIVYSEIIE